MATEYNPIHEWFYLSRATRKEGSRQSSLHYHPSYEIFVILSGSTTLLANDKLIPVSKNELVLLKPDDLHKNNGGTEHERYALHFTEHYLSQYLLPASYEKFLGIFDNQKRSFSTAAFTSIVELLRRMEKNPEYSYIHICELLTIIAESKGTPIRKTAKNPKTIDTILEYISKNYSAIHGLDEIANAVHISKQHLCKVFKKEMQFTVSEYLNSVRINNACEFLRESKYGITDIAMLCGYNSSAYFCKSFREIVHMSPMAYRKHILDI